MSRRATQHRAETCHDAPSRYDGTGRNTLQPTTAVVAVLVPTIRDHAYRCPARFIFPYMICEVS